MNAKDFYNNCGGNLLNHEVKDVFLFRVEGFFIGVKAINPRLS